LRLLQPPTTDPAHSDQQTPTTTVLLLRLLLKTKMAEVLWLSVDEDE
jgi:hypothetical protein